MPHYMQKQNLLTVKKFSDVESLYKSFRSEWLDDVDALRVKLFMQKNQQVPGFYQYTLTISTGESFTHETLCGHLTEYSIHQFRHKSKLITAEKETVSQQ